MLVGINDKTNYEDICETWELWKDKPEEEFCVGGLGEPTKHPDFIPFLRTAGDIAHSYTTNGVILGTKLDPRRDELLEVTKEICVKGVEIQVDPSLRRYQDVAIDLLTRHNVPIKLRHFVKDEGELERLKELWKEQINIFEPAQENLKINGLEPLKYDSFVMLKKNKIVMMKNVLDLRPIKIIEL